MRAYPNLPETLPEPSCLPLGARVLVQALYRKVDGKYVPAKAEILLGQMPQLDPMADPRRAAAMPEFIEGSMPPADLYLVIALGKGDVVHGVFADPAMYVLPGEIVALGNGCRPSENTLTLGSDQGIVPLMEIVSKDKDVRVGGCDTEPLEAMAAATRGDAAVAAMDKPVPGSVHDLAQGELTGRRLA